MVKILLLDVVAIALGLWIGTLLKTNEVFLLYLLSSMLLIVAMATHYVKARKRFHESLEDLCKKP